MTKLSAKEACFDADKNKHMESLNPKKRKSTSGKPSDDDDLPELKKRFYSLFKIASLRMDSYFTRMNHIRNNFNSLDQKINVIQEMLKDYPKTALIGLKNVDNKTIIVPVSKSVSTKELKDISVVEEKVNVADSSTVKVSIPPGHYGQVLKLNCEDDYPSGSWLGDPNKPDSRVRCHVTPRDLLYVEQENKTPKKMALALLDYLFDKETQALSNISGQGKHGKKMLDPLFIYGIQCHLTYKFDINISTWQKIKLSLDSKCRTAFNRKHKGLPLTSKKPYGESNSPEKCENQLEIQEDLSYLIENGDLIETNQGYLRVVQLSSDQIAKLHQTNQIVINEIDSVISYVTDPDDKSQPAANDIALIEDASFTEKEKDT